MKDYPTLWMRTFVVIVNQHRLAQKMGQSEFAVKCWPDILPRVAAMRWQSIRTKSRTVDKPQAVSLIDAQRMATVLNIDLDYLMDECTNLAQDMKKKTKYINWL